MPRLMNEILIMKSLLMLLDFLYLFKVDGICQNYLFKGILSDVSISRVTKLGTEASGEV